MSAKYPVKNVHAECDHSRSDEIHCRHCLRRIRPVFRGPRDVNWLDDDWEGKADSFIDLVENVDELLQLDDGESCDLVSRGLIKKTVAHYRSPRFKRLIRDYLDAYNAFMTAHRKLFVPLVSPLWSDVDPGRLGASD